MPSSKPAMPGRPALLALALLTACGSDGGTQSSDAGADGGGGLAAVRACPLPVAGRLQGPRDRRDGVLSGKSLNRSTSCTRDTGTGGPETAYWFTLAERTAVELVVDAEFAVALALRSACDDPVGELACTTSQPTADGVAQPVPIPEAPVPSPSSPAATSARLTAVLEPGTYFVLVDERARFGVGGPFTLAFQVITPPPHAACAAALPVGTMPLLRSERLDGATIPAPAICPNTPATPALYYTVTVPPAHRLVAGANALTLSSPTLVPQLLALDACAATQCLATGTLQGPRTSVLRHDNLGTQPQAVVLAVADASPQPNQGQSFDLQVDLVPIARNVQCLMPLPLEDDTPVVVDLLDGHPHQFLCGQAVAALNVLYFSVALPAGGRAVVEAQPQDSGDIFLKSFTDCQATTCLNGNEPRARMVTLSNPALAPASFIVALGTRSRLSKGGVKMIARLSAPRPTLIVEAPMMRVTSETGDAVTFTIKLDQRPIAPVEVEITSDDPGEGQPSPALVTFDPDRAFLPQTVTVTGFDDADADGTQLYRINTRSKSLQPAFSELRGQPVLILNRDDEAGFDVRPPGALSVRAGTAEPVTIALNTAPTATVRLPVASSDPALFTASAVELVFEPASWNIPQTVTVTAATAPGARSTPLVLGPATSDDPGYGGLDPADVTVTTLGDATRFLLAPGSLPALCTARAP